MHGRTTIKTIGFAVALYSVIRKASRVVQITLLAPVLLQIVKVLTLVTGVTKIASELLIKAENSFNED
jgi:hypothetical protein